MFETMAEFHVGFYFFFPTIRDFLKYFSEACGLLKYLKLLNEH